MELAAVSIVSVAPAGSQAPSPSPRFGAASASPLLSRDLLRAVFFFVSSRDLLVACTTVCRAWNAVLNERTLWSGPLRDGESRAAYDDAQRALVQAATVVRAEWRGDPLYDMFERQRRGRVPAFASAPPPELDAADRVYWHMLPRYTPEAWPAAVPLNVAARFALRARPMDAHPRVYRDAGARRAAGLLPVALDAVPTASGSTALPLATIDAVTSCDADNEYDYAMHHAARGTSRSNTASGPDDGVAAGRYMRRAPLYYPSASWPTWPLYAGQPQLTSVLSGAMAALAPDAAAAKMAGLPPFTPLPPETALWDLAQRIVAGRAPPPACVPLALLHDTPYDAPPEGTPAAPPAGPPADTKQAAASSDGADSVDTKHVVAVDLIVVDVVIVRSRPGVCAVVPGARRRRDAAHSRTRRGGGAARRTRLCRRRRRRRRRAVCMASGALAFEAMPALSDTVRAATAPVAPDADPVLARRPLRRVTAHTVQAVMNALRTERDARMRSGLLWRDHPNDCIALATAEDAARPVPPPQLHHVGREPSYYRNIQRIARADDHAMRAARRLHIAQWSQRTCPPRKPCDGVYACQDMCFAAARGPVAAVAYAGLVVFTVLLALQWHWTTTAEDGTSPAASWSAVFAPLWVCAAAVFFVCGAAAFAMSFNPRLPIDRTTPLPRHFAAARAKLGLAPAPVLNAPEPAAASALSPLQRAAHDAMDAEFDADCAYNSRAALAADGSATLCGARLDHALHIAWLLVPMALFALSAVFVPLRLDAVSVFGAWSFETCLVPALVGVNVHLVLTCGCFRARNPCARAAYDERRYYPNAACNTWVAGGTLFAACVLPVIVLVGRNGDRYAHNRQIADELVLALASLAGNATATAAERAQLIDAADRESLSLTPWTQLFIALWIFHAVSVLAAAYQLYDAWSMRRWLSANFTPPRAPRTPAQRAERDEQERHAAWVWHMCVAWLFTHPLCVIVEVLLAMRLDGRGGAAVADADVRVLAIPAFVLAALCLPRCVYASVRVVTDRHSTLPSLEHKPDPQRS